MATWTAQRHNGRAHLLQCDNCMGLGYVRVSVNNTTELILCRECNGTGHGRAWQGRKREG
jgi:DnaJ-class molecular chaperone